MQPDHANSTPPCPRADEAWCDSGPLLLALTTVLIALALAFGCALAEALEQRCVLEHAPNQQAAYLMLADASAQP